VRAAATRRYSSSGERMRSRRVRAATMTDTMSGARRRGCQCAASRIAGEGAHSLSTFLVQLGPYRAATGAPLKPLTAEPNLLWPDRPRMSSRCCGNSDLRLHRLSLRCVGVSRERQDHRCGDVENACSSVEWERDQFAANWTNSWIISVTAMVVFSKRVAPHARHATRTTVETSGDLLRILLVRGRMPCFPRAALHHYRRISSPIRQLFRAGKP
jgi:hypothetical protein